MDAGKAMWTALKCRDVWRPCLYMYLSLAFSLNIHGGMFYWYTDAKADPIFLTGGYRNHIFCWWNWLLLWSSSLPKYF